MPVYSNPDVLGADFLRLVNSPIGADVRLIIGEEQVVMHAHSLILQARSDYFARALNLGSDWKEANQGIIRKPNITPPVFERILQYIYGGKLMVDDDMVMDLIKAADELCMEDLLHGCERHALSTLCRANVLEMAHLASRHNLQQLKTECLDFIAANIDYLKRGKPILTLDADVLKEILSMDQLDLEELEVWKIAVRWAYYQQGLQDWDQCPLLEFPKGTGCVVVRTVADEGCMDQCRDEEDTGLDGSDEDYDEDEDAKVPLRGTNIRIERRGHNSAKDLDEDGFRPHAQSVFQQSAAHKVVELSATVHEDLRRQIAPVLSAIRFMRIQSIDFLRLIEGTGLVPVHLCAKVYRYHSVPSMVDPYQNSLRRRMAFSTILSKENKEVVLDWVQAALQGTLPALTHSGSFSTSGNGWSGAHGAGRRSNTFSSPPPYVIGSPIMGSGSFFPSSSSPPIFSPPVMSTPSPSPPLIRGFTAPFSPSSSNGSTSAIAASTSQQQQAVRQSAQQLQPKLILQYRATRDGFDAANFHMACDQRGPTLTVIRTDNGAIFGGYNSSSWSSHPSGVYSTSRTNFLFTIKSGEHSSSSSSSTSSSSSPGLRENTVFCIKGDGNAAAYNKADFGPTFGVGHDLFLASNCNMSCQSSSTMPSSYNGPGASTHVLAGSFYFRVQDYEVFLVQSSSTSA